MGESVNCKILADAMRKKIKRTVASLDGAPKLVSLQVGDFPSSDVYVRNQMKQATLLGIGYQVIRLSPRADARKVLRVIDDINNAPDVTGAILQLPLPRHLSASELIGALDPVKDAEGLHPLNLGRILQGNGTPRIGPCTAMAVMEILSFIKQDLYGREVVVVGHSATVGRPLSLLLLGAFATTTVCHIATYERRVLASHVQGAEILIVAVGKPGVIKGAWVKKGSVVIDVGINRQNGTIVGDVEFET
ncbi:MAG: bifunctional 5,10-methylenetetrahydrofolate dehydrogenase/5,10-methenyltetrahydrofolate cyclohydrolase, partial [Candidatus Omnitrophica bacterium]|nr:bifunctional 5,10-methylenetetrahydrofolate dehydrogenase/5,10-methenyltetrahydrofolate cyclohydrolase [Candidatus Omnitrophota bacterium]